MGDHHLPRRPDPDPAPDRVLIASNCGGGGALSAPALFEEQNHVRLDFRGHSQLGCQHHDPNHGRHLRRVPRRPGHGHDRDGGVLPLCGQRLYYHPVYGLGAALPDRSLAALPRIQRAVLRDGEPPRPRGARHHFRSLDRLCKAYFQPCPGYRTGALYCTYGRLTRPGRLYFCGRGAGTHQRPGHPGFCSNGGGPDSAHHPDDRVGLELLQVAAGGGRAVCPGGCALLYISACLCDGGIEGHLPRVPELVPYGRLPASAAGTQCLVPSRIQLISGPVHRQQRCADHRAGQHLSLVLLRVGPSEDCPEMRQLPGGHGIVRSADREQHGHGDADGRPDADRICQRRWKRGLGVRWGGEGRYRCGDRCRRRCSFFWRHPVWILESI